MIPRRSRIALTLALLAGASRLPAQQLGELCGRVQKFTVGQWSSYRTTGRHGTFASRFAIVGSEAGALWYEVQSERTDKPDKNSRSIIQLLVTGLGTPDTKIQAIVMKSGDHPAQRMPDVMRGMINRMISQNIANIIAESCRRSEVVGWESVTVPAGTFRALHVHDAEHQTDGWILPAVPFGMVKMTDKNGVEMVLTDRGTNAKSLITETPR